MTTADPRLAAIPDTHGHAKGEHRLYGEERPIAYTARMLFQWFYHASRRGSPRFLMVADHMNYLTFEDPAAVNLCRRALKLALAGDHYGAAETANVSYTVAEAVGAALRKGFRFSIGAEVDNDPRNRPDAQNIVEAMRPDGLIRSVHFLPITHPEHGDGWMWPFDNPEFKDLYLNVGIEQTWELYINAVLDAIEKLPGHILGHFFVPGKFGFWPSQSKLEEYEDRVIAACKQRGMAVEFNTRVLYKYANDASLGEAWLAANRRLLRKAKEAEVGIAVGSDAHSPMHQGGAFERVLALLDELEINELVFPVGGRLARVALRASEELIAAASQQETPIPGSSISGLGRKELGLPEEVEAPPSAREERATRRRAPRTAPERPAATKPARATGKGRTPAGDVGEPLPSGGKTKGAAPRTAGPGEKPSPKKTIAKAASAKATAAPKVSRSKKAAPAKKVVPAKKAKAAKKTAPTKKASPGRAGALAKKTAAVKKAAPTKKAASKKAGAVKRAAPVRKTASTRKAAAARKAATSRKVSGAKKTAGSKKAVAKRKR